MELMEFEIKLNEEVFVLAENAWKKEQKYRNKVRAEVNQNNRDEILSKYPTIRKLESSLNAFNESAYNHIFKEEVSWWVERRIHGFYNSFLKLSSEDINSAILNFEWYDVILKLMCRTYDLFYEQLFSLKDPENPEDTLSCPSNDANLVINMLDICNSIIARSEMQKAQHREQLKHLKKLKKGYVWSGQYQQDPLPAEGGIIKEEWLHFYSKMPNNIVELYISWDTGNKTGVNNAYSACCVIGVTDKNQFYLIDVIRGKYEMWPLLEQMKKIYDLYVYDHNGRGRVKLLIEDKASGTQAIQMLRAMGDRHGHDFDIVEITPNEDKISRLRGVSALIETGNILFPDDNPDWWKDFRKELLGFPGTKFKDQVDAFTQAITYPFKQLSER